MTDEFITAAEDETAATAKATSKAYSELKSQVKDSTERLVGETKRAFAEAKTVAAERLDQGRGLVEERPYQAVGLALLAGFLLGHLMSAGKPQVVYLRDGR